MTTSDAGLDPALADELLAAIDRGAALPSEWYTDPGHFELERRLVLLRGWHHVAHTGELPEHGSQHAVTVAGVGVVLVRDGDEVRGFLNICRHRAHPVVVGECERRDTLQCPYHGWTYDLAGQLRHAPRADLEGDFDGEELGLVPVQVEVWGPTIWVNVDRSAPPFHEWTAGLADRVASHGLDLDAYSFAFGGSWEIEANWKVFADNAIECYHCPTCHPTLSRALVMDPKRHQLEVGGDRWVATTIPLRSDTAPPYRFHWIFPTTYFQYVEGPGFDASFDVGTVDVRAVDRIVFSHLTFVRDDATDEVRAQRRAFFDADPTIEEDVEICRRVQGSHASGVAPQGRLLGRSEALLRHVQRLVVEAVRG